MRQRFQVSALELRYMIPAPVAEVFTPAEIRKSLIDLNAQFDGPGGVAFTFDGGSIGLRYTENDPVVEIPGDGSKFPIASFVEALRCSMVRSE
jgi:hypothetical protein